MLAFVDYLVNRAVVAETIPARYSFSSNKALVAHTCILVLFKRADKNYQCSEYRWKAFSHPHDQYPSNPTVNKPKVLMTIVVATNIEEKAEPIYITKGKSKMERSI